MEKDDLTFFVGDNGFNFRVAAFIHCENKVLLHKTFSTNHWNLIGGRVKFNEDTFHAIIRELQEELGYTFENLTLRQINENFFDWQAKKATEMLFVYDLSLTSEHPLTQLQSFCDEQAEYVWYNKNDITDQKIHCLPKVIYEMAKEKNWNFRHNVIRDN